MKRQNIVAGNWKMNMTFEEGVQLAKNITEKPIPTDIQVILCAPFIHLQALSLLIEELPNINISIGAQNCHFEKSGAFTGEISAAMIRSTGADFVIIGHSERREYFGEKDAVLAKKVNIALANGLRPIFCCGEKLVSREKGTQRRVVQNQLKNGLFHLSEEAFSKVIIAYEPVWAIGTGRTATKEQAQEMHAFIRDLIAGRYSSEQAEKISILYGGSCNAGNARELFSQPDVDGGLIGGASLKVADFIAIANSFSV